MSGCQAIASEINLRAERFYEILGVGSDDLIVPSYDAVGQELPVNDSGQSRSVAPTRREGLFLIELDLAEDERTEGRVRSRKKKNERSCVHGSALGRGVFTHDKGGETPGLRQLAG